MALQEKQMITPEEVQRVVSRLTDVIRMLLLKEVLPEQLKVKEISNGQLVLHDPERDEFEVTLTLNSHESVQYWRIISLNIHVSEPAVTVSPIHVSLMQRLKNVLQQRLFEKVSPQPLVDLYKLTRT